MSRERSPDLQRFLDSTRDAIAGAAPPGDPAGRAAARIFAALDDVALGNAMAQPARLPVCRHLETAFAVARESPSAAGRVAEAFRALEPALAWQRRSDAAAHGAEFLDGHASALIVGPGGLEPRDDARIGVSLVAPGVRYPDHQHPPEEVYLALSPSEWRQGDGPWQAPGIGGLVYNPPDVVHAMRAKSTPLLAIWCLWMDHRQAAES